MRANQALYAISTMARVLQVSESGFHAWKARPLSRRAFDDEALIPRIKAIHEMSDGTYGAPRVRAELKDVDGLRIGIGHVARLMRKVSDVNYSFPLATTTVPHQLSLMSIHA